MYSCESDIEDLDVLEKELLKKEKMSLFKQTFRSGMEKKMVLKAVENDILKKLDLERFKLNTSIVLG